MPKTSVADWDTTAANNTDINSIPLAENQMYPRSVNNAFREVMAQIATGIDNGAFGSTVPFTPASASTPAYLDFAEDTDNGTNHVRVIAPTSVAADRTATLQDVSGTIYVSGGTDVGLADGGTGASLADPNADSLWFWDDSAGSIAWLSLGTGLSISGTTLNGSFGLTLGTPVTSTSGTAIDFTGIPSTAKRVTVHLDNVSLSGSASLLVQLGDGGGVETSGYVNGAAVVAVSGSGNSGLPSTSGIPVYLGALGNAISGAIVLSLMNPATNLWVAAGTFGFQIAGSMAVGGSKALSAVLDRVRITTTNGTDTFDLGSINISYE